MRRSMGSIAILPKSCASSAKRMAFENPGLIFSIPVPAASSCAGGLVLLHFGSLMNALAEETKKLARLQAVDLERARLTAALKALPGEIAQADSQLKAAQKRVTDADAGLK